MSLVSWLGKIHVNIHARYQTFETTALVRASDSGDKVETVSMFLLQRCYRGALD